MGRITKKQKQRIRYYLKAKSGLEQKKEIIHAGDVPKYIARHVPVIRRIAQNIDQLVIVASFVQPPLKTGLIDRFLVLAELEALQPVICLNKTDLLSDLREAEEVADIYRALKYPVFLTSALKNRGLQELHQALTGRVSALAGHSGVGKSSLLNALFPGLRLDVDQVSTATKKGRHTTSKVRVYDLGEGTKVIDLPGIKLLNFIDIHYDEARLFYREFAAYAPYCKYRDCQHITEDDCAVKQALQEGKIHPSRYASYLNLVESLKNIT